MLQVMHISQTYLTPQSFVLGFSRARVEVTVMVASYDNYMLIWERIEPVDLVLNIVYGAIVGKVAGVDEDVAPG